MTWTEHAATIGSIHELTDGAHTLAQVRPWIGGQYQCSVMPRAPIDIRCRKPTVEEAKAWCERTLVGLGYLKKDEIS